MNNPNMPKEKWVSVNDRLPTFKPDQTQVPVLIQYVNRSVGVGIFTVPLNEKDPCFESLGYIPSDDGKGILCFTWKIPIELVSHWMPKPKGPCPHEDKYCKPCIAGVLSKPGEEEYWDCRYGSKEEA